MGLFDLFKTKPDVAVADDVIWKTTEAKLSGLCQQVQEQALARQLVLLVGHFPATLTKAERRLSAIGVPGTFHHDRLSRSHVLRLADQGGERNVLLVLAAALPLDEMPGEINATLAGLSIIVAERHFLRAKDEAILTFARTLGRPCQLAFHLSLQEPMMKQFAGEWVANMLTRLGMQDTEAISSKMVSRRIKGAQEKIAKRVLHDRPADSAEEWLRLNLPDISV